MAKISSWYFHHLLQVVWLKKTCKRATPLIYIIMDREKQSQCAP